ncbi:MAG: type II toxin-antitoxin system VapC family toxin [Bacteroidota bacterium]
MKYLIDTHILLWYILGDKRLKPKYIHLIDNDQNGIFISSVSIWEIALKLSIGKLKLTTNFKELIHYLDENDFKILEYDSDDLNTMIGLPFHHQDPFDRLIIAQSISKKLPIVSDDDWFQKYDVELF